jgi:co-chaperonin GroES (HSP10)
MSEDLFIFSFMSENLKNLIVIGDRVLLKPVAASNKTGSGLYLPPSVKEQDSVHTGLVVKAGPGYPVPQAAESDRFSEPAENVSYVPLQVREGDQALFLHKNAYEIEVNGERFVIVNQNAILLVFREDLSDLVL